jgi:predicted RecA/RadA family phage recombinase
MPSAKYRYGAGEKREYTPASAKTAGDVVVLDDGRIGVVCQSVEADRLGEVFIDGVFDVGSASATTASAGDDAYLDVSDSNNAIPDSARAAGDVPLGTVLAAKTSGQTVLTVDLNASAIDDSVAELSGVTTTDVQTLTNKRITPRVVALADAATITPNADTTDVASVAALSQGTSIANPTGTPTDGQRLEVRITTALVRALTYGTQFRATVGFALPTATLGAGATQRLFFEWIAAASKWDLVGFDSTAAASPGSVTKAARRDADYSILGTAGAPEMDSLLQVAVTAGIWHVEAQAVHTGNAFLVSIGSAVATAGQQTSWGLAGVNNIIAGNGVSDPCDISSDVAFSAGTPSYTADARSIVFLSGLVTVSGAGVIGLLIAAGGGASTIKSGFLVATKVG